MNTRLWCHLPGVALLCIFVHTPTGAVQIPQGMNLGWINYYGMDLPFTDAATTFSASIQTPWDQSQQVGSPGMEWMTKQFDDPTWRYDTHRARYLDFDEYGYPLKVPVTVQGESTYVHTSFSNNYEAGNYVLLYDGEGDIAVSGVRQSATHEISKSPGRILFYLSGIGRAGVVNDQGTENWNAVTITRSTEGDHIRNIRIIPERLEAGDAYRLPENLFNASYMEGLKGLHILRFMEGNFTNNNYWVNPSNPSDVSAFMDAAHPVFLGQKYWSTRTRPGYFTMASFQWRAMPYEYMIEMCNQIGAHLWVNIPHAADDEYIRECAALVRSLLDPRLKCYIEYSNETWNWAYGYPQSTWLDRNATDAADSIRARLAALGGTGQSHVQKRACMAKRTFDIWRSVFAGQEQRLVRVAAGQLANVSSHVPFLDYLEANSATPGDKGYDVISATSYCGVGGCSSWTSGSQIVQAAINYWPTYSGAWNRSFDSLAAARGAGYITYEGGSHMNADRSCPDTWDYYYAANFGPTSPSVYQLYMNQFSTLAAGSAPFHGNVVFMYTAGSLGHIRDTRGLLTNKDSTLEANPKLQALLDGNTEKGAWTPPSPVVGPPGLGALSAVPHGTSTRRATRSVPAATGTGVRVVVAARGHVLSLSLPASSALIAVYAVDGTLMCRFAATGHGMALDLSGLARGSYVVRASSAAERVEQRVVIWR